jgi:hypothetical protein
MLEPSSFVERVQRMPPAFTQGYGYTSRKTLFLLYEEEKGSIRIAGILGLGRILLFFLFLNILKSGES